MLDNKLELKKEMKSTWLIQRLQKPHSWQIRGKEIDNPFSFGGGLHNGGLSDNAMSLLRGIFSFDYMGSAEFEWGSVPRALQFMAEQAGRNNLIAASLHIKDGEVVYYIAPREYAPEVVNRIKLLRKDEISLKESCELKYYFDGFLGRPRKDICGWLELDNGYMFFTDRNMYDQTCKLFGIELVNK
jgi:hypothetical protein